MYLKWGSEGGGKVIHNSGGGTKTTTNELHEHSAAAASLCYSKGHAILNYNTVQKY